MEEYAYASVSSTRRLLSTPPHSIDRFQNHCIMREQGKGLDRITLDPIQAFQTGAEGLFGRFPLNIPWNGWRIGAGHWWPGRLPGLFRPLDCYWSIDEE